LPSDVYKDGETKICSREECEHDGKEQPSVNFGRHNSSLDGLSGTCKDCHKKLTDRWRDENQDRRKHQRKEHYAENIDLMREKFRSYYREVDKAFRSENWAEYRIIQIRSRCAKRKIPFDIDIDDLLPLPKFCPLFGILLDYHGGPDRRYLASVDRIKPRLGYVKGNVRIISNAANFTKIDGDDSIFDAIRHHMKSLR